MGKNILKNSKNLEYVQTEVKIMSALNDESKKQIDFGVSEYVMRLYQNGSNSGTGTQKAKWSVYTSDLKSKYAESTTGTASNAKVTLLLEWQ